MGTHFDDYDATRARLSASAPNPRSPFFEHDVRAERARCLRTVTGNGLQRIGRMAAMVWASHRPTLPTPGLLPEAKRFAGG